MFELMSKRTEIINKKFYVRVYAISLALFLLGVVLTLGIRSIVFKWSGLDYSSELYQTLSALKDYSMIFSILAAFQFLIIYPIFQFLLLFKMWTVIQDEHARTTPAKAIGFLFIPFFGIYWLFNVWGGFPTDYNKYIERHNISAPPLSSALYIIFPLFNVLSSVSLWLFSKLAFSIRYEFIAFLTIVIFGLTVFLNLFIFLALNAKTCDSINALNKVE